MNLNELVKNEREKWEGRMKMWYDNILFKFFILKN